VVSGFDFVLVGCVYVDGFVDWASVQVIVSFVFWWATRLKHGVWTRHHVPSNEALMGLAFLQRFLVLMICDSNQAFVITVGCVPVLIEATSESACSSTADSVIFRTSGVSARGDVVVA
jgi:hypothetical protein